MSLNAEQPTRCDKYKIFLESPGTNNELLNELLEEMAEKDPTLGSYIPNYLEMDFSS
jgi:hypothetical protein